MRRLKATIASLLGMLLLAACSHKAVDLSQYSTPLCNPSDASGFEILTDADSSSTLFVTHAPWQGAAGQSSHYVMTTPPRRIVVMSSSHIAMLDAIGAADAIVGVSGKRFISNPTLSSRLDSIVDVGYEGNIDYEALLSARPDIVLLYGINGASTMEPKLNELGIPFAYIGDYMESTPLGKAEWMRFLGHLTGRSQQADSVYSGIASRYNALKTTADTCASLPGVMLNAPMGDTWYLAAPDSYMAILIADAAGRYLYDKPSGQTSVPVDFETGYSLAADADIWLNAGNVTSHAELLRLFPKLAGLQAVKTHSVYNNIARMSSGGGNDFWESGTVNPDVILADIIRILHPELLPDHALHYFLQLK